MAVDTGSGVANNPALTGWGEDVGEQPSSRRVLSPWSRHLGPPPKKSGLGLQGREAGGHDAGVVDLVLTVQIGPAPGLAEFGHSQRKRRGPQRAS